MENFIIRNYHYLLSIALTAAFCSIPNVRVLAVLLITGAFKYCDKVEAQALSVLLKILFIAFAALFLVMWVYVLAQVLRAVTLNWSNP